MGKTEGWSSSITAVREEDTLVNQQMEIQPKQALTVRKRKETSFLDSAA
jgi:hypothetical protein